MTESQPVPIAQKPRCLHVTPDRLVLALLTVESLFWLSDRLGWPAWHKGYAVLIGVASAGIVLLVMFGRFVASLVFRWQFQFTVRSLLVLVVAVAVPCSWLAVEMKKAEKQREAVEAIRTAGGWVEYDYERDAYRRRTQNVEPPEPAWVRRLLGDDMFARVVGARLPAHADIVQLEDWPELWWLNLDENTQVTDAGLAHLSRLNRLEQLGLDGTKVSDDGLVHLRGLSQLRWLGLARTQVTKAGLADLESLPQLESLELGGKEVTDAWLFSLERLPHLRELHLVGTKITHEGVKRFRKALPMCNVYPR